MCSSDTCGCELPQQAGRNHQWKMRQWNCLCNEVTDLFEWTRNVPLITITILESMNLQTTSLGPAQTLQSGHWQIPSSATWSNVGGQFQTLFASHTNHKPALWYSRLLHPEAAAVDAVNHNCQPRPFASARAQTSTNKEASVYHSDPQASSDYACVSLDIVLSVLTLTSSLLFA